MILGFFCMVAPDEGGATPIADSRKVLTRIASETRERFKRKEVRYVRNYGADLDLSWQDVFQTDDPAAVEEYCRAAGIDCEWRDAEQLRTSQLCQTVATHPETHEQVWFNQAHLFHISSLEPEVRDALLNSTGELPRNAVHGDGSAISDEDLQEIRSVYETEAVEFDWQQGDVLVVDNMLVAHGRRPYRGDRKIVVAMGRAYSATN
jgi:alpha-ketoglutarate-dependent taurine dioxygenase